MKCNQNADKLNHAMPSHNCKSKVNQFVERCLRAVDTYQLSQPI